jgi:uncharacterized protein
MRGGTGPVWFDLANSPHVLFFRPVLDELHRRGLTTYCTARDFAQTVPLCTEFGIDAERIGQHGGAGMRGKVLSLQDRVMALRAVARRIHPCVAVSHNSYAQLVAARSLRVPTVTAMDYEHQPANHLAFRCADLVAVPDAFPLDCLRVQGAHHLRTWRYHGLKEHITLAGFRPNHDYLSNNGIDVSRTIVVVRPPAHMALYHRFENPLFVRLLSRLEARDGLDVILLPRTPGQASELEAQGFGDIIRRGAPLDGRELIAGADAVISAGGSMNREAAVLGTPAYSIYAGALGAVDRTLVASGHLRLLTDPSNIDALQLRKKEPVPRQTVSDVLLRQFVDRIQEVAEA